MEATDSGSSLWPFYCLLSSYLLYKNIDSSCFTWSWMRQGRSVTCRAAVAVLSPNWSEPVAKAVVPALEAVVRFVWSSSPWTLKKERKVKEPLWSLTRITWRNLGSLALTMLPSRLLLCSSGHLENPSSSIWSISSLSRYSGPGSLTGTWTQSLLHHAKKTLFFPRTVIPS